jgi:hypothetical protein
MENLHFEYNLNAHVKTNQLLFNPYLYLYNKQQVETQRLQNMASQKYSQPLQQPWEMIYRGS